MSDEDGRRRAEDRWRKTEDGRRKTEENLTLRTNKPIRVLVVDDSAFMRKAISKMLSESQDFVVVDTARNGEDALRKAAALDIDVMTLDIDMPGMNGLAVLERVMKQHPLPVVMVSSLTEGGAAETIRALELGAVDFVPKHLGGSLLNISAIQEPLQEKVRTAAKASGKIPIRGLSRVPQESSDCFPRVLSQPPKAGAVSSDSGSGQTMVSGADPGVVVIGCSTGGPQALQAVLPLLPAAFPIPIVVAQHMPKFFTKPFAERLNQLCALDVREAQNGDHVKPGAILIAPGGQHMTLEKHGAGVTTRISEHPTQMPYRPSVDLLMESAAKLYGRKAIGLVLTGMGQDGLEGARAIKRAGGPVIAQDEASCVVYGMPKAVAEHGCADKVIPLRSIANEIQSWGSRQPKHDSPNSPTMEFAASHS